MCTYTPRHARLFAFTYLGVAALFFMNSASPAESAPSVDTIVKQANHTSYYQGRDGRAKAAMTITDSQGRIRNRAMTILRRNADPQTDTPDADGEQKMYVYFHRPPDVNKMVFMVWKHVKQDDDRWLYLPVRPGEAYCRDR